MYNKQELYQEAMTDCYQQAETYGGSCSSGGGFNLTAVVIVVLFFLLFLGMAYEQSQLGKNV